MSNIPLSKPDLVRADLDAVIDTLHGERLSQGRALLEFERKVAHVTRRPHAIGVSSGATALELALRALDIGDGDEVLVPSFAFPANTNAVLAVGATPVFVDADHRTLCMSATEAETKLTPRTRAVLGVPIFGAIAGLQDLIAVCARAELPMVENAAEAFGSTLGPDNAGRFGRITALGFGPNRPIAMGEGGAIVTNDDRLAMLCRAMRNQGRTDRRSFPDQSPDVGMIMQFACLGYDARLAEPLAALGASQIDRLDSILERRTEVARRYVRRLCAVSDLIVPSIPDHGTISWPLFWVRLSDRFGAMERDAIVDGLHRHDIGAANHYPACHLLPHVRAALGTHPGQCPVAESLADRTITLPMYTSMSDDDVDQVCATLELLLGRIETPSRE
ncbi:MAG: DegT/DnrJ/EryC1/StrS aminotransferase family protein [Planctomycetes bacterium]|nr:DegT/DnrJ/EryC1/StrS aminotransferase family protein [Planctomycetota bacterium]